MIFRLEPEKFLCSFKSKHIVTLAPMKLNLKNSLLQIPVENFLDPLNLF